MSDPLGRLLSGETAARVLSSRMAGAFATTAALKALEPKLRAHGHLAVTVADRGLWVFDASSAAGASSTCLVPDSGAGRWLSAVEAEGILAKRTVQITHADLTEAANGTSQAINVGAALPTNAVVLAAEVNIATLFSGGGATSVKLDLGGTDIDAIAAQHDVFTGAATGALAPTPAGVHPRGKFSAEQLKATFTPDGGHALLGLTAGDLTITVWYSVLA